MCLRCWSVNDRRGPDGVAVLVLRCVCGGVHTFNQKMWDSDLSVTPTTCDVTCFLDTRPPTPTRAPAAPTSAPPEGCHGDFTAHPYPDLTPRGTDNSAACQTKHAELACTPGTKTWASDWSSDPTTCTVTCCLVTQRPTMAPALG